MRDELHCIQIVNELQHRERAIQYAREMSAM
jgi:hypothetical protein